MRDQRSVPLCTFGSAGSFLTKSQTNQPTKKACTESYLVIFIVLGLLQYILTRVMQDIHS